MWLYRCRVLILSPVDKKITNLTPFAANSNWFIILKLRIPIDTVVWNIT